MAKIPNDKYYTPKNVAKDCIDLTIRILGDNITEMYEPSAGNGSFSLQIDGCKAYDLIPEHPSIVEQDFLGAKIEYKKGRCVIGNPPFGSRMNLGFAFLRKASEIGDYIAFILPISQKNNSFKFWQFDLIYSESIGILPYSGVKVECCFNIYMRPSTQKIKPTPSKIEGLRTLRIDRGRGISKNIKEYEFGICAWGASCGKITEIPLRWAREIWMLCDNEYNTQVLKECIKSINFGDEIGFANSSLSVQRFLETLDKKLDTSNEVWKMRC